MKCGIPSLRKFHELLKAAMAPLIVGDARIEQAGRLHGNDAWTKQHFDGEVHFYLVSDPLAAQVQSEDRRPVHQLRGVGDEVDLGWVYWHERWSKKRGDAAYDLVEAGFAFYWGPRTHLSQVFRAEWSADGAGSNQAAHPHWHLDCGVFGADLVVSSIHFGMAGWANGETCPGCWQHYPTEIETLQEWAFRTLEYSRQQLERFPPEVLSLGA